MIGVCFKQFVVLCFSKSLAIVVVKMAATTSDASTLIERGVEDRLFLFDRRTGKDSHELCLPFSELKTLESFKDRAKEVRHNT